MKQFLVFLAVGTVLRCSPGLFAQATQPADDAVSLYMQAAKLVNANCDQGIMSPAASNLDYRCYPPFPPEWQRLEEVDFPANQAARVLAHQARSVDHANWIERMAQNPDVRYLNLSRVLSNELADASLYQHLHGEDAAAIETLRDQLQLANSLQSEKRYLINLLVSIGIREEAMERLNVIISGAVLTRDPQNRKDLQIAVARELMEKLVDQPKQETEFETVIKTEASHGAQTPQTDIDRGVVVAKRVDAECGMAAISLACHLYRFDTGRWPTSINDLRSVISKVPVDPFGDGKQTLGYVLIKSGLPNGDDRPLTYSRRDSKDGLFFETDQPYFSYYFQRPKQGGQFRDIAAWSPRPGVPPVTQPLDR